MSEPARVWVFGDAEDVLDRALVESLTEGLGDDAVVEQRSFRRAEGRDDGVGERLRKLVLDREEPETEQLAADMSGEDVPDVVLSSRPGLLHVAAEVARRGGPRPVRIGLVRDPVVDRRWLEAPADLLAVVDEHAASTAHEREASLRVVGAPVLPSLAPSTEAPAERRRQGLEEDAHVMLLPRDAIAPAQRAQLLVQLSLVRADLEILFEVDDSAAAEQLRQVAPAHGLGASLVPRGEAGARFWPLAHVILGRPTALHLGRARAAGVPLLALPPEGAGEGRFADDLVESGAGRAVESMATLAVDVDLTLEPERYEKLLDRQRSLRVDDPAARCTALIREALDRREELTTTGAGLPSGLERISRPKKRSGPPAERFDEAARAATEVRDRADLWAQRASLARDRGEGALALEAEKRASRHQETLSRLLDRIRPDGWREEHEEPPLEEELEALRRRAMPDDNVEQRLRSLEVEDELRALKESLDED